MENAFIKDNSLCPSVLKDRGYSISENIGGGAFSKVYKASCTSFGNKVLAVKIIFLNQVPSEWKEKCLRKELKIIQTLQHPNIIRIIEIIKTHRRAFIFMEFAENNSVAYYLQKNGEVSEYQALVWFSQTVSALYYLHSKSIAHRDLKNENILLDKDLNAKLTDFGFSCYTYNEETFEQVFSPTCCGTMAYIAPEVLEPPYDAKIADIWSLGICLYEMLCNARPFDEKLSKIKFIQAQKARMWKFKSKVEKKLSCHVKSLISEMLEPDISRRIKINKILSHPWIFKPK